ncbi:unnamed protein product [Trichobilharzia regenti]|nr:unnamed protein product [Trichobilharzia regenti]
MTQAAWLQHDLGHSSVFKSVKTNHIFHEIILGFTKGASCHWWNHMHSQHHAKPNVIDKDPDTRLEPVFVVGENLPRRAASSESKWSWHLPYEYQHKYFFLIDLIATAPAMCRRRKRTVRDNDFGIRHIALKAVLPSIPCPVST